MKYQINLLPVLVLFCTSPLLAISGLTGRDIMTKNNTQMKSDYETYKITMKLVDKRDNVRERIVDVNKMRGNNDEVSQLIRFTSPADVKGTGFLSIEHRNEPDERWLFLPALRRSRRITPSDDKDSFMGTEFSYGDIIEEDLDDYTYKLMGKEVIDNRECYKVKAIPKTGTVKKNTGYSFREIWIDTERFVRLKVNYYDLDKAKIKTLMISKIRRIEGANKWRPHKMRMQNFSNGKSTVLLFEDYTIGNKINSAIFTKRNLEKTR